MFQTEYFYHVYNKGVAGGEVFMREGDYMRFLLSLREFNCTRPVGSLRIKRQEHAVADPDYGPPLVKILAYCLNPNHFHLLLQQLVDGGISEFMKRMGGYTKYINKKYGRYGVLFQGKTRHKHIDSSDYLEYVSAYINGNPEIHGISPAEEWKWSSCKYYLGMRNSNLCCKRKVFQGFKDHVKYQDYLYQVIKESAKIKKDLKKLVLE